MTKKKNIVLIGFMGSGKTTVGKLLAKILKYDFIDTDDEVIAREGVTIPFIFENKGEEYFRQSESIVLQKVMDGDRQVISTGGGIVTISGNIPIIQDGIVIYLKATPDHIYNNVKKDSSRPLLQDEDVYNTICTMLQNRESLYERASRYKVTVDEKTPKEICNQILHCIKEEEY